NRFCLVMGPVGLPPKALTEIWPFKEIAQALPPWVGETWKRWTGEWAEWFKEPEHVYRVFYLWVLTVFLMTVGLFTRTATVVAWLLSMTFHHRLNWVNNGGDALFRVGLFYLMLSPAGAVWSLDHWWKRLWAKAKADALGRPLAAPRPVLIAPWSVR